MESAEDSETQDEPPISCAYPGPLAEIICEYLPHPCCIKVAIRLPILNESLQFWRLVCQRQYPIVMRRGKGKRKQYRRLMQDSGSVDFWRSRYADHWRDYQELCRKHEERMRNLEYQQLQTITKRRWETSSRSRVRIASWRA